MKKNHKIFGLPILINLFICLFLSLPLQAGNERGGAIAVDVLFQSSFAKIKSYFINLNPKKLSSEKIHSDWLKEASIRNPEYNNLQIIQSYLYKKIELKFLAFAYGPCNYQEDGVKYKAALCFDLNESGKVNIEIARSELKHLVAKDVSNEYAQEQSSILLLHELAHLSGVKDHQIANQIAIDIYRAIVNIDLQNEIMSNSIILDNEYYVFSPKVFDPSYNEYEIADFICQVFYKKEKAISFDLSESALASKVLYFEKINGGLRYKKALTSKHETVFNRLHCLN